MTEGVDVPAVDMVAFMSPKKSKVDIVQATGRAMRKSPNKELGYVLIPLFLDVEEESIEEALEGTGLDDIWNVLQAMQEQDEELVDVIRQMREDKGCIGGFNDARLREKIETLAPSLMLETLQTSISAACVDRLGVTWDERYGELKAYNLQFGDCNIPTTWAENIQLSNWISNQRSKFNKGQLLQENIDKLNSIGFVWDILESLWNERLSDLVKYKKEFGNCNVPARYPSNQKLAKWVSHRRGDYNSGKLDKDKFSRLEQLGFVWDIEEDQWNTMYAELLEFKNKHGHCKILKRQKDRTPLMCWVGQQRTKYNNGVLEKEKIRQLDEIGFVWSPFTDYLEEMFAALVDFKKEHGHCNVPANFTENPNLTSWVSNQRHAEQKGKLDEDHILRMNELGFVWDQKQQKWDEKFTELLKFKTEHSHCNVPKLLEGNQPFASWVLLQRQIRKKGKLSQERIDRLTEIGFVWDVLAAKWKEMLVELLEFKKANGHCNVPYEWKENIKLARWVATRRSEYRRKVMAQERVEQLESIGFEWASQK